MRRTLTVIVALSIAILALAAAASAGESARMRAAVPFSFYAAGRLLPSGEYLFELQSIGNGSTGSTIFVRNAGGEVVHIFPAMAGTNAKSIPTSLEFRRYGDIRFLSKLHTRVFQAQLAKSRMEREVALAFSKQAREGEMVAAAR